MAVSRNVCVLAVALAAVALVAHGSPIKATPEDNAGQAYSEEELSRLLAEQYRAGYERAVYDLYAGRYHDVLNALPENTFAAPSKKAIDLGLGRFNAGSRAANSLMALDSARFAGGPGRK
ncbi:hypothetical protein RvY_05135 [Ramazzottius varieornatus]|uniref:Uncharacterized protein n=1 Tax=Ramazzottius varieornatus TaxID=947166 RepID=A0A1D1UZQ6_RAMVA|nr:hypothetical protein RvY_05135 [Ramazzottius varieornatus]